jgi:hypothetical protein
VHEPSLRIVVAIVVALVLALTGCGSSQTKTVTVTNGGAVAATPTAATPSPAQVATGTSGSSSVPSPATTPTKTLHVSSFRTPSSNIGCVLLGGVARCDIDKRNWKPPPRPKSCPSVVDFGQGLLVTCTNQAKHGFFISIQSYRLF